MVVKTTAEIWLPSLLLRCGDIESNPGPSDRSRQPGGMPTSRSRVSMASIRSAIDKRRKEVHIAEPTPLWFSCRMVLSVMGFLGFLNLYAMRVNLSVAMVCMINQTAVRLAATPDGSLDDGVFTVTNVSDGNYASNTTVSTTTTTTTDTDPDDDSDQGGRCGSQAGNVSLNGVDDGEFAWSKETQGVILGSFFWGYMTTQIAGGWLGALIGGKRVYGWFMFGCSVCTLFMPLAARTDYRFLLALRFLAGVGQGVTFPAMNVLWANWAPPLESSKLGGFSYSGSQLGNVVTFPIAGLLCEYGFDGGWPSIFYVLGLMGLLWFLGWCVLVFDSPAEHPRISPAERDYITASLKGKMTASREASIHVPWRAIFTCRAVWGIIITHTCSNFGTYTFLTNIPTYMKEVLHFDIKQNGLLSALPYVGFWLTIVGSGQLADIVRSRGLLNTTQTRKVGNSLGMLLPGAFVAVVGYMSCQQATAAVVLLTVGVAMSGFQYGSGWMVNPVDIAPRYAGVIFGISNTLATIPGFLAPMAIGFITKNQTQAEWRTVFFIATAIYTVGALAYVLLGSGELQPWARQSQQQSAGMPTSQVSDREMNSVDPECKSLLTDNDQASNAKLANKSSVSFSKDKAAQGQGQARKSGEGSEEPSATVKFY